MEIQRRDQEILAMATKMKTLEEQHQVNFIGQIKEHFLRPCIRLPWKLID